MKKHSCTTETLRNPYSRENQISPRFSFQDQLKSMDFGVSNPKEPYGRPMSKRTQAKKASEAQMHKSKSHDRVPTKGQREQS